MKRLLLILILTMSLQSWTKADDISDFEIEGMSIGDSVLGFHTEKSLKQDTQYFYSDKKWGTAGIYNSDEYDRIQFTYNTNNNSYKIHGLAGVLTFHNNIDGCKQKMKKIVNEVESIFGNNVNKQTGSSKRSHDKSGKSIMYYNDFEFRDKSAINIYCTDWSKEMTDQNDWRDELKVSLYSVEFSIFLLNN